MKVRITVEGSSEEFDGMNEEQLFEHVKKYNDDNFKIIKVKILEEKKD